MEFGDLVPQAIKDIFTKKRLVTHSAPPEKPKDIIQSDTARGFAEAEAKRRRILDEVKNGRSSTDTNATGTQGKP